jgi:adenosylcobinamide-phosphate synthase
MIFELNLLVLVLALMLDRIVGDPDVLWARLPHPIVLFGKAISRMETLFNRTELPGKSRRRNGMLVIAALLLIAVVAGVALHLFFALFGLAGILLEVLCVTVFLAQKSLADHVEAVASGLRQGGLDGGRKAVSMIVGRDPETLDEPAVCRAAIESLAENFSDGVVAPALWYLVFGLPGLLAYKMLNTADSMIGHKSERYVDFGWASARLDGCDASVMLAARRSRSRCATAACIARRTPDARKRRWRVRSTCSLRGRGSIPASW